jgi:hypothetical protein
MLWSTIAFSALCRPAIVPLERRTVALSTGLQMEWLSQPAPSAVSHPVLFVHGTFHGAWCWAEVRARRPLGPDLLSLLSAPCIPFG